VQSPGHAWTRTGAHQWGFIKNANSLEQPPTRTSLPSLPTECWDLESCWIRFSWGPAALLIPMACHRKKNRSRGIRNKATAAVNLRHRGVVSAPGESAASGAFRSPFTHFLPAVAAFGN